MATTLILAVGDADLHDALNLNDGVNFIPTPGSFKAPPPVIRVFRSRTKGTTQTQDPYRNVTFDLQVFGQDDNDLMDRCLRPLELKLEQARAMSGPYAEDARGVCLWVSMGSSTGLVYFDVVDGELTYLRKDEVRGATAAYDVAVTLKCRQLAHGQPVTYRFSLVTIGQGSLLYLPNLPGDAPGLVQLSLVDGTTGGGAISRYRLGTHSLQNAGSGDYTHWVGATPTGIGATYADTSSLNGTSCVRSTLNSSYQPVANISMPSGAAMHGLFDAWALVRDSVQALVPPTNLTITQGAYWGSHGGATYVYIVAVTAVDASGHETAASMPLAYSANADYYTTVAWTAQPAATHYNVYVLIQSSSTWYDFQQTTGNAASLTFNASMTAPTGWTLSGNVAPPNSSAVVGLLTTLHPFIGLAASGSSPTAYVEGPLSSCSVGDNLWEVVPLGVLQLPPVATPEGAATPPWVVTLYAQAGTAGSTPTFDVAGLLLLKHNQPSMEARLGPANGGAPSTLLLDTRRDERVAAVVNAVGGAVVGGATAIGQLLLGPGNGFLAIDADVAGGVHDTTNAKVTPTVRFIPRYQHLRGGTL